MSLQVDFTYLKPRGGSSQDTNNMSKLRLFIHFKISNPEIRQGSDMLESKNLIIQVYIT